MSYNDNLLEVVRTTENLRRFMEIYNDEGEDAAVAFAERVLNITIDEHGVAHDNKKPHLTAVK